MEKKMKEENENFIKQNINVEFRENPQNLKLRDTLTTNATSCDQRAKFTVYIGLQDHRQFLPFYT